MTEKTLRINLMDDTSRFEERLTYWLTHNKPGIFAAMRRIGASEIELRSIGQTRVSFLVCKPDGGFFTRAEARIAGVPDAHLADFDRQVTGDELVIVLDWSPGR